MANATNLGSKMPRMPNRIVYHNTVSMHSTLAIDIEIAKCLQFDGLEVSASKVQAYLNAGHTSNELQTLFNDLDVPGIGFLIDLERQGSEFEQMMREAEQLFNFANLIGAPAVQILTGPVDVNAVSAFFKGELVQGYRGGLDLSLSEQVRITGANAARLADSAKDFGLLLYLEALAWTPLNTIDKQLAVIGEADRDNLKMVIDFWHCYASSDTPDRVSRIDRDLIYGVHVCDSLTFEGGIPNEDVLRDVPTGRGALDLLNWVQAVKATGYDDWWSCELFSKRLRQENSFVVAAELKDLLTNLIREE
jgi:sugar phosphate isomerase/epimerase